MIDNLLMKLAIGGGLVALSGCASIDQATQDFQNVWDKPRVEVTPTATEEASVVAELRVQEFKDSMAAYSAPADCAAIQDVAPRILVVDEIHFDSFILLAECAYQEGDYARAKHHYTALERHQKHPRVQRGLGMTALKSGDYQAGLSYFADYKSNELEPDWRTENAIGFALDKLGNYEAAEASYRLAADLGPAESEPMNNLGMSYLSREDFGSAIRAFGEANAREPNNPIVELNLRMALALEGQMGAALAGADLKRRAAIYNAVGVYLSSRGEHEQAKGLFLEALETSPVFF